MEYRYLDPITLETATELRDGVIMINDDSPESPFLEVYKDGKFIPVDNLDTMEGMAKFDNLATFLINRDWCIGPRLFIDKEDLYISPKNFSSPIPVIKKEDTTSCIKEITYMETNEMFEKLYMNLINMETLKYKEIDLENEYFNYLISTRNLIEKSSVIDLYSYSENSMNYTSTLNLNELLQRNSETQLIEDADFLIKIGIAYTKSGKRMTNNFLFNPFSSNMEWEEFTHSMGDVTLEFRDGCIRLFPNSHEVTECIIHYCYAVYEELL